MNLSRCDRCNAAAKEAWQQKEFRLTLCGHHANDHRSALIAQGWRCTEIE